MANADCFLKAVQKYTSFEGLAHTLLREFVEASSMRAITMKNSTRKQGVEIYYSFIGKIDLPA